MRTAAVRALALGCWAVLASAGGAADKDWTVLIGDHKPLEAWKTADARWQVGGGADMDPKNPRKLIAKPGKGVLVNGARVKNLVSKEVYTDVEVHLEFLIAKGSNSGVKLNGHYEIQILDSHRVKEPKGQHCGGIYPKAESKPKYHYLDEGVPPKVNAAKAPGEWQTLDIVFVAPRFDEKGQKTAHGKFVKVVLNGKVIHEHVEVKHPTGAAYVVKEVAKGPLLLQADHGPVAFRNVRVRPYQGK